MPTDETVEKSWLADDYRTRGGKPPTKAERDSLRALLESRARDDVDALVERLVNSVDALVERLVNRYDDEET